MKHGVSCSIYIPDAAYSKPTWDATTPYGARLEFDRILNKLPGYTITPGTGLWQGIREPVHVVTCVVPEYRYVEETFQALAAKLKERGEQQVFITVQPISFILE